MSTLSPYRLNSNSHHGCGVCHKPIVNPNKVPTRALAHKKLNQKYSETPSCFFHPSCIKKALTSSLSCPTCETELEAPKGLLSFKDKCLQKVNQVRRAISPYCSPTALKKAMKAGYDGAVLGAQFAASVLSTQIIGISETPWDDVEMLVKSGFKPPSEEIKRLELLRNGLLAFTISTHLSRSLMHVIPKDEAFNEETISIYRGVLDEKEANLATPGISPIEKSRLIDDITRINTQIKKIEDSLSLNPLRGAMLTVLMGGTYLASSFPGVIMGAALGVLAGGILSTKQITQVEAGIKRIRASLKQLEQPIRKTCAALIGGCLSAALAESAGLAAEGQVIAGGFGAGAVSSFI